MNCEICKKEIKTGQYIVRCSKCNKTYHSSCWVKNLGCSTKDCNGAPTKQFKANNNEDISKFSNINNSQFNPKGIKINRCPVCKHIVLNGEESHTCSICGTIYHQECWEKSGGCILNCQSQITIPTDKTCAYCMMPINSNEEFIICPKCNIPHHKDCWEENGGCTTYGCDCTKENINQNNITPQQGLICPYCQSEILPNENIIYCPQCNIPHHESCWNENGGCTTYGCNGISTQNTPPPIIQNFPTKKTQAETCCNGCMTAAFIFIIIILLQFIGCI